MRYMVFLVVLLFSGCVCVPSGGEPSSPTYTLASHSTTPSPPPLPDDTVQTTSTQATPSTQAVSPTTTSTIPSATTSTTQPFNAEDVLVQLAGCDSDDYGNAMVAGYVSNPTTQDIGGFRVVTELQTAGGEVVASKHVVVLGLPAGTTRPFSVVYQQPPAWTKCRAYVTAS